MKNIDQYIADRCGLVDDEEESFDAVYAESQLAFREEVGLDAFLQNLKRMVPDVYNGLVYLTQQEFPLSQQMPGGPQLRLPEWFLNHLDRWAMIAEAERAREAKKAERKAKKIENAKRVLGIK